ncbi:hypothetical protein [Actinomadura kijaniata]|uniref:hypothetical protein n=1 Tax=Actinomadura kijaniata TaxID=46161 RepID=UPI00082A0E92|nr:hypothetical protein [Actinomadura kijaniata]
MSDLDRGHEFAVLTGRGTYRPIRYDEAVMRHRRGEQLYRRILPGHALTRAEKHALPWEPVPPGAGSGDDPVGGAARERR